MTQHRGLLARIDADEPVLHASGDVSEGVEQLIGGLACYGTDKTLKEYNQKPKKEF